MKRLIGSLLVLVLLTTYLMSCEKDDICADGTPTTPSLVVEFYNNENHNDLKPVSYLTYQAVGSDTVLPELDDDGNPPASTTKITLPLRTDATTTQWALTTRLAGNVNNTDIITFNYVTQEVFVSRACGYKTSFTLNMQNDTAPGMAVTDNDPSDNLWIKNYSVITRTINNEDETHIEIYH